MDKKRVADKPEPQRDGRARAPTGRDRGTSTRATTRKRKTSPRKCCAEATLTRRHEYTTSENSMLNCEDVVSNQQCRMAWAKQLTLGTYKEALGSSATEEAAETEVGVFMNVMRKTWAERQEFWFSVADAIAALQEHTGE